MNPDLSPSLWVPFLSTLAAFVIAMVLWELRALPAAVIALGVAGMRWLGRMLRRRAHRVALRVAWLILRSAPPPQHESRSTPREEPTPHPVEDRPR